MQDMLRHLLALALTVMAAAQQDGRKHACFPRATLQQDILENSNLYDIAYEWSKHRELMNWKFTQNALIPDKMRTLVPLDAMCAHVAYDVSVIVPAFVRPFIDSSRQTVSISKYLCIDSANKIYEKVFAAPIPFIEHVDISMQYTYEQDYLLYSYSVAYPSFWYTDVASKMIMQAFDKSIMDAIDAFVDKMC